MQRFFYSKDLTSVLKGTDALILIARKSRLSAGEAARLPFDKKLNGMIRDLAKDVSPGDLGSVGSTLTLGHPRRLILGALPDQVSRYHSPAQPEGIYKILGALSFTTEKVVGLVFLLDEEEHMPAALNAMGRSFPDFTRKKNGSLDVRIQVLAMSNGKPLRIPERLRDTVETARYAAGLVDMPPSELNPATLSAEIRKKLRKLKRITTKEIVGSELAKSGLGGLLAVGRCAEQAPRILVATYVPRKASKKHVALVGKGITFDTGGLHIKGRGNMETMKADMGGSAAVAGAFMVLVRAGYKHKLSLVMCLAENAIGPAAYKPDDILKLHSGKTVEINNTDAEGRLLLADGVSYAARILKASTIIDAATLTGAQLIAVGSAHAAIISNDSELEDILVKAGTRTGDLAHPLPFAPELYKSEFSSKVADMKNSVKNRMNAQASCAAQFIYNHIDDLDVRWGHIDLAGPAFRNERGTGYGVALISEAALGL